MNPLTNVRNVTKLSERELKQSDGKTSWHDEYRSSAWIFIGGLPYELTEGDVIAVFSQYGEPVNLNLIRDKVSGKSKGFGFLCYEDQKSTILAVDNLNAIKISGRTIRVDHVKDYKPPKDSDKIDDITRSLYLTGCGPGVQLPGLQEAPPSSSSAAVVDDDEDELLPLPGPRLIPKEEIKKESKKKKSSSKKDRKKSKKDKKSKKSKKSKSSKKRKRSSSSSSDSSSEESSSEDDHRSRKRR